MAVKKTLGLLAHLLGFVAIYIAAGLMFALAERDTSNTAYEIFRTKALHADQADSSRRILLVGGSNVIYGYRSEVLEQSLHIPTTNMAINSEGGDPIAMRELSLSMARDGDIVVYSSIAFWNLRSIDTASAKDLLHQAGLDPATDLRKRLKDLVSRYWLMAPRQQTLASALPRLYRRYVSKEPTEQFKDYNEYGDWKACPTSHHPSPQGYTPPPPTVALVDALRDYQQRLREKGATLVLDISWLYVHADDSSRWLAEYQRNFQVLKQNFVVTTRALDDVLVSNGLLFCDSEHHLVDAGALLRSQRLATFLAATLAAHPRQLTITKVHSI